MHTMGRRLSRRKAGGVLVAILVILLVCARGWYSFAAMKMEVYYKLDKSSFKQSDRSVREQLHFSKYVMGDMHNFTRDVGDIGAFRELPLEERCSRFFEYHEKAHPDWTFGIHLGEKRHDKSVVSKKDYFASKESAVIKKKKQKNERNSDQVTDADRYNINKDFEEKVVQTHETENEMADSIAVLRLYGQCFLNHEPKKTESIYHKYTKKLFPFLSGKIPVFQRFDGTIVSDGVPIFDKDGYTQKREKFDGGNVIEFMKKNANSKGIVISVSRTYIKELISLIRVLRALNNRLPIQLVYRQKEFGLKNIAAVVEAARSEPDELLQSIKDNDIHEVLNKDILNSFDEFGSKFPQQELWLVNLDTVMLKGDISRFSGYKNKILAYYFNSFDEIILLDSDSVPLIPPEQFFDTGEYKSSGTLMFKDRSLGDTNDFIETNFFTKLFPVNRNNIDELFDIPLVTKKTLENKYMTGWRHFQEAGVVVLNRRKHYLAMLMTLPLAIWRNPVESSIWGDKEMYWLGMAMAGDEAYEFNKYSAASVGVVTDKNEIKLYTDKRTKEICSNHPGHVNSEGKLLWVNSGFDFCKKNGFSRDKNKFPYSLMTVEEVKAIYREPMSIRQAIVPPDLPNYREPGSPPDNSGELKFKKQWRKRKPDIDEINNDDVKEFHKVQVEKGKHIDQINDYLPQQGWVKTGICSNYMYCAYNTIGGYGDNTEPAGGKVFDLSSQQKLYDFLGQIWMSGKLKTKNAL